MTEQEKFYAGIAIGETVSCVVASTVRGLVARSEFELPRGERARALALSGALAGALSALSEQSAIDADRVVPTAVGIAVRAGDEAHVTLIGDDGSAKMDLPVISNARILFSGYEIIALFSHFGAGPSKAWIVMDELSRVYAEGAEFGQRLVGALALQDGDDGRGPARGELSCANCHEVLEPVRVLLRRLGLFESLDDVETMARLIKDSEGVRFVEIVEKVEKPNNSNHNNMALMGLKSGIRRPHIALAALESVACAVRYVIANLAGEGVLTDLYVAGSASRSDLLMEILADMTGVTITRSEVRDAIAYGAAMRAAMADGRTLPRPERKRFNPTMPAARRDALYAHWVCSREQ